MNFSRMTPRATLLRYHTAATACLPLLPLPFSRALPIAEKYRLLAAQNQKGRASVGGGGGCGGRSA
jgi:hypothetical protein